MRFTVEQEFSSSPVEVAAALASSELYGSLPDLPKLSPPELLTRDADGEIVRLRIRYRFVGELSSAARAVLDPARLSWVESSAHDLASLRGTFTMEPDHYADRFSCRGSFRYQELPSGCRRDIEGELRVRAPLVAGAVERAIVSGLREHLEHQAPAVDAFLSSS